jgi:hypothetical protein
MIYTYQGFITAIKDRLSLLSSWDRILYYGVYERIVDLLAYTGEKLVYVAEFLYREAKWITAEKRQSLVTLARWFGYIPYRKFGAVGILKASADPTFNDLYTYSGKEVRIPRWAIFKDVDRELNVYCTANTFYSTGYIGNLDIPVKEGTPKEYVYVAKGEINECIYIYSDSVDETEVQVTIVDSANNFLYDVEIVANLYLVNDNTTYTCQIENDATYTYIKVCFGDGINSRKLSIGERILVKYADTKGDEGDITSSNIITVCLTDLIDEDNQLVTLYFKNTEGITGGTSIEDIESIRNNAPNMFQVGSLLASEQNWEAVINSAPYVDKSKVWTVESLGGSTTVSDQNVIFITAVSNTGEGLTSAQQSDLQINYIIPKKCLTEALSFETLEKVYARFDVIAKISSNQTFSVVDSLIKTALNNEYDILNTDFQQNIYESNFYRIVDSVPDVVYHSTVIYYMERDKSIIETNIKLLTSYTSVETDVLEDQNYLVLDSFEIWIKRKIGGEWEAPLQIAYTSGVSVIGMNGYTISGGFVSYSTNQYSYNINEIVADVTHVIYGVQDPGDSDDLGYVISICYKMQDGNGQQTNTLRLPYFYQITDIDTDYIDTDLSYIS